MRFPLFPWRRAGTGQALEPPSAAMRHKFYIGLDAPVLENLPV